MKHEDKRLPGDVINDHWILRAGKIDMTLVQQLRRNHTVKRLAELADEAYEEYWQTSWWKSRQRDEIAARRRALLMARKLILVERWYRSLPIWNGSPVPGQEFYRSR